MKMREILSYLEDFNPTPAYSQISVNGEWENAVRIDFDHTAKPKIFDDFVDPSIALEVFYTLSDGRLIFIGLRYDAGLAVGSPEQFLKAFIDAQSMLKDLNPGLALRQLGKVLNNDPNTYTGSETSYVELGVADYWKTFDHPILRKHDDPHLTSEYLKSLLSAKNGLLSNDKNYVALEFAYPKPEHWMAIQVSEYRNDRHETNLPDLLKLVNMV